MNLRRLTLSFLICLGAGFFGSLFTSPKISEWYVFLEKPSFNPPDWVFAPVWTILFLMMGFSLYLVWEKKEEKGRKALYLFFLQLALNVLWSIFFFGLQLPLYALIEIFFLWGIILLTIVEFYSISRTSAYLLFPYILWVSFAMVLNLSIALLNL